MSVNQLRFSPLSTSVLNAQQSLCSIWIIDGDDAEEGAWLLVLFWAGLGWVVLQEERQMLAGMDAAGLAEEPCPDGSLCQYAQKITACFGGIGKTLMH